VSVSFARIRVDSASSTHPHASRWDRSRVAAEGGQTMAEYGVVLTVIVIGIVVAIGLLSGAIATAISRVLGYL
jgi:hypothetical protein